MKEMLCTGFPKPAEGAWLLPKWGREEEKRRVATGERGRGVGDIREGKGNEFPPPAEGNWGGARRAPFNTRLLLRRGEPRP